MSTSRLTDLRLVYAPLTDVEQVDTPVMQRLKRKLGYARRHYELKIEDVGAGTASAERIGFIALASRMRGVVASGELAAAHGSVFGAKMTSEAACRTLADLKAVFLPALEQGHINTQVPREIFWERVRLRLAGYVAWALSRDLRRYRALARERSLHHAFDPSPVRNQIIRLGGDRDFWEKMTGSPLELVSDQEADLDRERARAELESRISEIEEWLADEALVSWRDSIARLEVEKRRGLRLDEALGVSKRDRRMLRLHSLPVPYGAHELAGAFMSGSSLGVGLHCSGEELSPDYLQAGGELEASLRLILTCHTEGQLLLGMFVRFLTDKYDMPPDWNPDS